MTMAMRFHTGWLLNSCDLLVLRHLALARVEHLDVTAQRDGGDPELGAAPCRVLPQRIAEADREAQHTHAAAARHPEMAEFVESDQQAQGHDHPPDGAKNFTHACAYLSISKGCKADDPGVTRGARR